MIPLSLFLIIWLILLGLYFLLSLLSVVQMMRFGVAGPMVYVSTFGFLILAGLVITVTGVYLLGVDWSLSLDMGRLFANPALIPE